jgi:protein-disulfide isomerase-like protein with CxxC motif
VFDAMQGKGLKLAPTDLLSIAQEAGLDIALFEGEREQGKWLEAVAGDHHQAVARWRVFGTPTLVFQDDAAVYLKFTALPLSPAEAAEVLDALLRLARCHPELVEIKYPHAA